MLRLLIISFVVSQVCAKSLDNESWKEVVSNVHDWTQKANKAGQSMSKDMVNDAMASLQTALASVGDAISSGSGGLIPSQAVQLVTDNITVMINFWQTIFNQVQGVFNQGIGSVTGGGSALNKAFLRQYLTIIQKMSETYLKAMLDAQKEYRDIKNE